MIEAEAMNAGAAASPEAPAQAPAADAPAAEKKPARRRVRKDAPAAEASGAAVSASEAAAPAADAAPAASEEKPAAKRRGRPRKVAVEAAPASDAAPSAEAAEQPAPKPRRTRTRKAAPAADAASEAASANAVPEASAVAPSDAPASAPAASASAAAAANPEAAAASASEESSDSQRPRGEKPYKRERQNRNENRSGNGEGRGDGGKNRQDNGRNASRQNGKQNNQKQSNRDDRFQRRRERKQNREVVPSVSREELAELKVADLRARAAELELDVTGLKKAELVDAVYDASMKAEGFIEVSGVLDILADGYGFLRASGYLPGEGDAYVGTSTIRRNGLRKGDFVVGQTRPARENEKFAAIQKLISVNGMPAEDLKSRPRFADLTPIYPDERLLMEHGKNTTTARVIDLAAPIGKGQRGLIVSPPKAGKTTVLKDIAASITANNPEVHLMCLLVDERPEEVTDMERSIKGEVISSTFDMPSENHIAVAELVIERAKRLVEMGRDVVILLDSITRLARAYNLAQPASGRILSGGVDSTALYPPKRFLGAARNIEGGGSLTILASALIDTGSKMDEVIFEEFKGTGNMELKLDRYLADRRIFPAIDPVASGTRKEELLLDPQEAPLIWAVRRILSNMNNTERAMDMLIKSLKQTDTNQEFLLKTAKKAQTQHGKSSENFEF